MKSLLKLFFRLLYNEFAWTYDLVSAVVSFGNWQNWVQTPLAYLGEGNILELGFGPGHLQNALPEISGQVFGIDLSPNMVTICQKRLERAGHIPRLAQADNQFLPFSTNSIDQAVATFPTEVLFSDRSIREIARVLKPGGKLVFLPMVFITGSGLTHKLIAWTYRITEQSLQLDQLDYGLFETLFDKHQFTLTHHLIQRKNETLHVIEAVLRMEH